MADGNLLSKLVLSAIIVLFSLLFSCANVLGFLVRKLRRKANDYRMLWLEVGFNDVKWEKFCQSKKTFCHLSLTFYQEEISRITLNAKTPGIRFS